MKEMIRHVEQQCDEGAAFDFILVTGDIAFSGKAGEYALAEQFFENLESTLGVNRNRIFCVPGNHDIDRSKQTMAFIGARSALRDQSSVDDFLTDQDELKNLLTRQLAFRNFQGSFSSGQVRHYTADGLAYTSRLEIDDLSITIVGLDTTWLAEGGGEDHGHLLMGEMQAINAMTSAWEGNDVPNVVIAIAHHPFHVLQEFDYLSVQPRIERQVHFFHHGHLHTPHTRLAGPQGSQCLTIAAGASYATRHDFNAYSIVTLDLLNSVRSVSTFTYDPRGSTYALAGNQEIFPIEVMPASLCSIEELANALRHFDSAFKDFAHYLSAIVLGHKTDFPIAHSNPPVFASIDVVRSLPDSDLKSLAIELERLRNVLRVLCGRKQIDDILQSHGTDLRKFAGVLAEECKSVPVLTSRLVELNDDAQRITGMKPRQTYQHTHDLFLDLAENGEWHLLNEQAERHIESDDVTVAVKAKRMCALALANIAGTANKLKALEYYRALATSGEAEFNDARNLVVLLIDVERMEEAVHALFSGMRRFPANKNALLDIGQIIVSATGDRQLRKRLEKESRRQG